MTETRPRQHSRSGAELVGLSVMLIATQTGRSGWLRDRTRLYHIVSAASHISGVKRLGREHRQDHDGAEGEGAGAGLDRDHRAKRDQRAEQRLP